MVRDGIITAIIIVFAVTLGYFCTGCNSDLGLPGSGSDMHGPSADMLVAQGHPVDGGMTADLAQPADMATGPADLAENQDMAEQPDLAPNPDLVVNPDLVPDQCAARFTVNSVLPPDQLLVVGTRSITIGSIDVSTLSGDFTVTQVFTEYTTRTGLVATDLQNLKLFVNGQSISQTLPQCRQNGNSVSCTHTLLKPLDVKGGKVSISVFADIGGPGDARLGDSFAMYAGPTAVRLQYQGVDVDFQCIHSIGADDEAIIVPFLVNVTGDAPAPNSKQTQTILDGSEIGRFKIENTGNATATIMWVHEYDKGSHTGRTTRWWLKYSNQNNLDYTANTAVADFGNVQFDDLRKSGKTFDINGGHSFRYITTGIKDLGMSTYGDTFQIGVFAVGDIKYTATEADLGYDANLDGQLSGNTIPLPVGSTKQFPIELGTLEKQ